ncbi:MAG: ferrochelatase [Thermoplasmata archaeon]
MSDRSTPEAVLLLGYGSPRGPEELPAYLAEVLHGRTPRPEMVADYVARYARIGGSPQLRILRSLREKLERRLASEGRALPVYLAMKHGSPRIAEVLARAVSEGHRSFVAVPLSPYASTWITEPYRTGLAEGLRAVPTGVDVDLQVGWHLDPDWIGYWGEAVRSELDRLNDPTTWTHLSAHSLPKRFRDRGDPYPEILEATAREIARAAGLARWSFTYQSPGNTTEPWLGPTIEDQMLRAREQEGARAQLIASFGFVFDHLEVLYDLDVVVQEFARARGLDYHRVPMPNDSDRVVAALARTVGRSLPGPRP